MHDETEMAATKTTTLRMWFLLITNWAQKWQMEFLLFNKSVQSLQYNFFLLEDSKTIEVVDMGRFCYYM